MNRVLKNNRFSLSRLAGALLAISMALAACAADPTGFQTLGADQPIVQIAEGLSISANPAHLTGDFGVRLAALPAGAVPDEQALAALPGYLEPVGPIFTIESRGALPTDTFLAIRIPAGVSQTALDLYGWDGERWRFLAGEERSGQQVAAINADLPKAVGLFSTRAIAGDIAVVIEPGETLPALEALDTLLLGGVYLQADGSLAGQLPNVPPGSPAARMPVVRNYDASVANVPAIRRLLDDPTVRANHIQALAGFVASGGYAGVAVDYRGSEAAQRDAFSLFALELSQQLRAQGHVLWLVVDPPAVEAGAVTDAGRYDWAILGTAAEALLVRLPPDPRAYGDGRADTILTWLTRRVDRRQVRLVTSGLSVGADAGGAISLIDTATALSALGTASPAAGAPADFYAGDSITLTLTGQIRTLAYDAPALASRYTYAAADGTERALWLTSPAALRQRLALADTHRLGGVAVTELLHPGTPPTLAGALTDYAAARPADVSPAALIWAVSRDGLVVAQATARPGQPFVFALDQAGAYQFTAQLQDGMVRDLGSLPLQVAAARPTAAPAVIGGGGAGTGGGGSTVFVPPPPVASGSFELGGQVPGGIAHPAQMQQAGMRWVKIQVRGDASSAIGGAKAAGFKVLLSVIGDKSRATQPAYWDEYAAWVGGMAAAGADAIEVWNEPNIDHEWPNGQISGATYTQLLARAYAAIKAANPGTLVISAGPAPTGAEAAFPGAVMNDDRFLQEMAAAGAANYMDCIGIHYNSGTTSPNATSGSALSGYHYSYYFWPMVDLYYNTFGGSRQLCFTELGYVSPEGFSFVPSNFSWASNTTVAQQAQWLAEAASLGASSGKVRLMIVWNVDFVQYTAYDPQAGYAIIRPDGSCPACAALDAVMP